MSCDEREIEEPLSEFLDVVSKGEYDKVAEMLEADPSLVDSQNDRGMSAIILATYCGQKRIVNLLVSKGARLSIYEASAVGDLNAVIRALEREPSLLNSYSKDGFPPLGLASFFGNADIARFLLERGADPNLVSKNLQKVQPLHSAVAGGYFEISKLLISHGANLNAKQEGGFTPLHEAAQSGNLEIAKVLVEGGAKVNERNNAGKTPLALARISGKEAGREEDRKRVALFLVQNEAVE